MEEHEFYHQQLINSVILPVSEQNKLIAIVQKCRASKKKDRATTKLVNGMIRMVFSIAKKYRHYAPFQDLISVGKIGLLKAIQIHDSKKGMLSTIATTYINNEMSQLANEKSVRYPLYIAEKASSARRMEAANPEMTQEEIQRALELSKNVFLTVRDYRRSIVSLDAPLFNKDGNESEEGFAGDRIIQHSGLNLKDNNPTNSMEGVEKTDMLRMAMADLNDRDRDIIISRWLTDKEDRKNLDELAKKYKRTRECIRQYEAKALKHIGFKVKKQMRQESELLA